MCIDMVEYEVTIPTGVEVHVDKHHVEVKGPKGTLKRDMVFEGVKHEIKDGKLVLSMKEPRTKQKAVLGTMAAHIRNMVVGVSKGYIYKLKIVFAHFPINASVEGKRFVIKNFSGEKKPRFADILGDTKVKIEGQEVFVEGIALEEVSQTAANIETATKIRGKDLRVFSDGIYITNKAE